MAYRAVDASSLLRLSLLAVCLTGMQSAGTPSVLIVGLDSGDWDYLDPLMESANAPVLGGLAASGVRADYDCSLADPGIRCFCPMVWTSIYSGWPSAVHEIRLFQTPPAERKVPAIWNVLRDQKPAQRAVLATAHSHSPAVPEATRIITFNGALGVAEQSFDLQPGILPDLGDPSGWAIPATLFEAIGLLPHVGPTPTVWDPFGGDRIAMEGLKRIIEEDGVPALTAFIFHSLDKTMHLRCSQGMDSPDGPVDAGALLALADAWTGPVEGLGNFGTAASQYLEAELHVAEILALGTWDYVMVTSDHGMMLDPVSGLPCHHVKQQAFDGVFALTGPGVKSGIELPVQDPLCTAPLLAYLLNLQVSQELPCVASGVFETSVLPSIFTAEHLAANPPGFVPQWQFPAPAVPTTSSWSRALLMALMVITLAATQRRGQKRVRSVRRDRDPS